MVHIILPHLLSSSMFFEFFSFYTVSLSNLDVLLFFLYGNPMIQWKLHPRSPHQELLVSRETLMELIPEVPNVKTSIFQKNFLKLELGEHGTPIESLDLDESKVVT